MSWLIKEGLFVWRLQLRMAGHWLQMGHVWANSIEAELRDMERH